VPLGLAGPVRRQHGRAMGVGEVEPRRGISRIGAVAALELGDAARVPEDDRVPGILGTERPDVAALEEPGLAGATTGARAGDEVGGGAVVGPDQLGAVPAGVLEVTIVGEGEGVGAVADDGGPDAGGQVGGGAVVGPDPLRPVPAGVPQVAVVGQ